MTRKEFFAYINEFVDEPYTSCLDETDRAIIASLRPHDAKLADLLEGLDKFAKEYYLKCQVRARELLSQ
jgi:hypothetical protein